VDNKELNNLGCKYSSEVSDTLLVRLIL